jgi:hypothetical protein
LVTTADDYLRWLMSLDGSEPCIDAPSAVEELFTPRRRLTGTISSCFGLWCETDMGETRLYSVGMRSGFSACCFVFPEHALAGVAVANCGARTDELRRVLDHCARRATGGSLPPEWHLEPMSISAANRTGTAIRLESGPTGAIELLSQGVSHRMIPLTDRVLRFADEPHARHVLRVARSAGDDAIITIGDQRYVEDLHRLLERRDPPPHRTDLTGAYHHPLFGEVEVLVRDGRLSLEFGAMYESPLEPVDDLHFIQRAGPFRREVVDFRLDGESEAVSGFAIGGMVFDRREPAGADGRPRG